jgi:hypothetical protein
LFAHCNNRNPRFDGIRNISEENVDLRNNIIYNWGTNSMYAGEGGHYNIVNNYYKYGPNTSKGVMNRVVTPGRWEKPVIPFGKFYVEGNYVDGFTDVTKNNSLGVEMGNKGTDDDKKSVLVATPFSSVEIPVQSALDAYNAILLHGGASFSRDTLDERIMSNVKNRTGNFIDVQGGYPHGTEYEKTIQAWPTLASRPAPADADKDCIPDEWEKKHGLNQADISDASKTSLHKFYSNLEVYINSLIK